MNHYREGILRITPQGAFWHARAPDKTSKMNDLHLYISLTDDFVKKSLSFVRKMQETIDEPS